MTDAELDELVSDCPRLFHMAERGAFPGIMRHGLLSTSALLDLFQLGGMARERIERRHRPEIEVISHPSLGAAAIRDQKPMDDAGLRRALPPDLLPSDWYAILNAKVFFWLSEERLLRLKSARAYRDKEHEILVLDTRRLIASHRERIWLCPINSGCTKPYPAPRSPSTFSRIADYPYAKWRKDRKRGERVVELCVDHGVADVEALMVDAYVMKGTERVADLRP